MDNTKLPVSIIIPSKNEKVNIVECLNSLAWVDEIYVVDSQSTDGSAELAASHGAHVVQFHYDGGWPKKKNWAIRNLPLRNEWIMIVDADERVPADLRDEIAQAIQAPNINGYYVRWRFVFLGRWMKHCWNDGWMLRLFRRGSGEYENLGMTAEGGWDNEVHENIVVSGKVGYMKSLLLHESRQDVSFWIAKQNQFSDWWAKRYETIAESAPPTWNTLLHGTPDKKRKLFKSWYLRMPCKPIITFCYLYFWKFGFLDGRSGFYFCLLRAVHALNIQIKCYELSLRKPL